jgi:hypothetical protein
MTDPCRKTATVTCIRFFFVLALLFTSIEGCATDGNTRPISPFPPSMGRQGTRLVSDTLFFGLSSARGPVSQVEWDNFLRDIVTPRFPDGLTYWEANGQWRGSDNKLVREHSMVLQIIHPESPQAEMALQEISLRYQQQYEQGSVLRIRSVVQVWH